MIQIPSSCKTKDEANKFILSLPNCLAVYDESGMGEEIIVAFMKSNKKYGVEIFVYNASCWVIYKSKNDKQRMLDNEWSGCYAKYVEDEFEELNRLEELLNSNSENLSVVKGAEDELEEIIRFAQYDHQYNEPIRKYIEQEQEETTNKNKEFYKR